MSISPLVPAVASAPKQHIGERLWRSQRAAWHKHAITARWTTAFMRPVHRVLGDGLFVEGAQIRIGKQAAIFALLRTDLARAIAIRAAHDNQLFQVGRLVDQVLKEQKANGITTSAVRSVLDQAVSEAKTALRNGTFAPDTSATLPDVKELITASITNAVAQSARTAPYEMEIALRSSRRLVADQALADLGIAAQRQQALDVKVADRRSRSDFNFAFHDVLNLMTTQPSFIRAMKAGGFMEESAWGDGKLMFVRSKTAGPFMTAIAESTDVRQALIEGLVRHVQHGGFPLGTKAQGTRRLVRQLDVLVREAPTPAIREAFTQVQTEVSTAIASLAVDNGASVEATL